MSALVFGHIGFDVRRRTLVVFRTNRTDLPHLTCSWNDPTGEVDLHLTPVSPRDNDDRESLLKIQESELKARFHDLVREIIELVLRSPIQMVWGVHPKWLAAGGYVLFGPTCEPVSAWFQRALSKRRGEYRLDERTFKVALDSGYTDLVQDIFGGFFYEFYGSQDNLISLLGSTVV